MKRMRPFAFAHGLVHSFFCTVLFLATLCLLVATPALAADLRGRANVAVMVDLAGNPADDAVTIHLVGNKDRAILSQLAGALGQKFRATPVDMRFVTGDPAFVADGGIGLDLTMPIVPRDEAYLPVAPFIEAFAPYAADLRIVYVVQGDFAYRGYQHYEDANVAFTMDPPEIAPNSPVPFAFYGMHVKIKNPSLTTLDISKYPEAAKTAGFPRLPAWMVIAFAAAFGAAIGIILLQFIPRKRSPRRPSRRITPTRETRIHDGTRHDERQ